ncbi:limbic system-associated membrane protein-like [Tachypleus tridentatus]|uniref:limbic system-associated membrane protein-like n=1 Tax=Tachypleus tridentatus TaxID=6853 RepID=UPI003FCFD915
MSQNSPSRFTASRSSLADQNALSFFTYRRITCLRRMFVCVIAVFVGNTLLPSVSTQQKSPWLEKELWQHEEPLRKIFNSLKSRSQNQPSFSDVTITNVTTQFGQTVFLHCFFEAFGDKTVSWVRLRDYHVLTVGKYTYTTDDRFKAFHTEYSNEWTLKIELVQESDSGFYECQMTSSPPARQVLYLRVVVPQAKIHDGSDLFLDPGSPINLTCVISDSPELPIFIFWYHNNRMINYDLPRGHISVWKVGQDTAVSNLLIEDAQPEDSGNYTCGPSNTDAASVLVHVVKGAKQASVQNDGRPLHTSAVGTKGSTALLFPMFLCFQQLYQNRYR